MNGGGRDCNAGYLEQPEPCDVCYGPNRDAQESSRDAGWHMILPLSRTSAHRGSSSFPMSEESRQSSKTPLRPNGSSTSLSRHEMRRQASLDKKRGRPINLGAAHRTGVIQEETIKEGKSRSRPVSVQSDGGSSSASSLSPTSTEKKKKSAWRRLSDAATRPLCKMIERLKKGGRKKK